MVYIDQWKDMDDMDRTLTRRDFLLATGLMIVSGKMVYNEIMKHGLTTDKAEAESIVKRIYNEYPKYQHMSYTESKVTMDDTGEEVEHLLENSNGYGIVVNDKYVTVAHVVNNIPPTLKETAINSEEVTILYDVQLDTIIKDIKNDFAVFQIPKEVEIKHRFNLDDICFDEPKLSERVYIIGNPRLTGHNVRSAYVSDLDSAVLYGKPNKLIVGFDKPLARGDSGTFTVNKQGKVMAINVEGIPGVVGYGVKMKAYEQYLKH